MLMQFVYPVTTAIYSLYSHPKIAGLLKYHRHKKAKLGEKSYHSDYTLK